MRNLASIQKIKSVQPVEGADQIEKAAVLGWQVIVKKGEFKPGNLCVYCEIDSLMPDVPEFEFLKPRGMRIKTIRLRGQISQGICFPLTILGLFGLNPGKVTEGQDVTQEMRIEKYEAPIPANLAGVMKGKFPSFIPKTDETRVQVLQDLLDKFKGTVCYVTEKLDGSSVTYFIKDGEFGVCSRNMELLETEDNTIWKVARELNIEKKLGSLGINCAVQAEMIGEGIQSNKYKQRGQTAKFFNFFYIDGFQYAGFTDFKNKMIELGLDAVPVISEKYELENDIDTLIRMSAGNSLLNPGSMREGIVIRPLGETVEADVCSGLLHNNRVSFKVINPEFLLKYGE
ncbi:MAG: RNA ligase (ATP) [Bacteroidetes bacterium]|nr:RNA ligase (ATP) [Bacteroidota bacterium]